MIRVALIVVLAVLTIPDAAAQAVSDAATQAVATRSTQIQQQVEAIAAGEGIGGRRSAIVSRLDEIGLQPALVWFDPPPSTRVDRRGANIVAEIPGRSDEVLLLGAHYDHVELAQGVIDNAAGVAAVLELAEAFIRQPLSNLTLRVAFFDLEEAGLLGSKAMVRDSLQNPLPTTYLNFDVFGYGDAFWISALQPEAALPRALQEAGVVMGLPSVADSLYPRSDHLSFRNTSTASYAISLLDLPEIDAILQGFRGQAPAGNEVPRVLQIIHTTEDTIDKLDSEAVARGLDVVEAAIRKLDAAAVRE